MELWLPGNEIRVKRMFSEAIPLAGNLLSFVLEKEQQDQSGHFDIDTFYIVPEKARLLWTLDQSTRVNYFGLRVWIQKVCKSLNLTEKINWESN